MANAKLSIYPQTNGIFFFMGRVSKTRILELNADALHALNAQGQSRKTQILPEFLDLIWTMPTSCVIDFGDYQD